MTLSEERVAASVRGLAPGKASPAAVAGTSISSLLVVLVVTALAALLEDRVEQRGGNVVLGAAFVAFASVLIGIVLGYLMAAILGSGTGRGSNTSRTELRSKLCRLAAAEELEAIAKVVSEGGEPERPIPRHEFFLIREQCRNLAEFVESEKHVERSLHWVAPALIAFVDGHAEDLEIVDRRAVVQYCHYLGQALASAATCDHR